MKVVVIGGVAAGPSFATRLRRLDEQVEITLFERGEHISYASCALPYYLGGIITDRDALIERTPAILKQKNNIDVRIQTEITAIDPVHKTVQAHDLTTQQTYQVPYDKLVLATGAQPVVPPIPGLATAENAFTIRSISDADRIAHFMDTQHPQTVTIIGAGAAGVELAENLNHRGLTVTLVDQADQVLAPFDPELAAILETEIKANGIQVRLNTGVQAIEDQGQTVVFADQTRQAADLILVVTGATPNHELATQADLTVSADGHIVVDQHLQTSTPDIYAIGDVIETTSLITGQQVPSQLSSPANRQGHLLADIIHGANLTYPGFIGVSVAKIFNQTASMVGYSESMLQHAGITDYDSILITPFDHAFFYPNAQRLNLKLTYHKTTGQIFGGQFVGYEGVDKRAGELATAIAGGLTVADLPSLELPYSPPYSSTRDPLNVAGYVALNRMQQLANTISFATLTTAQRQQGFFLDIREAGRPKTSELPEDANIPLSQLRQRLAELPQDRLIYLIERKGLGPYNATRILAGNGFNVKIITA